MSTTIKKRLEHALEAGQEIDKEQRSTRITSSCDHELSISNQKEINLGDENGIYTIALSQDGSEAAVGLGSGILQLYNCNNWEKVRKLRTGLFTNLPLLAVKFFPCITNNTLFTGGSDGVIKAWNLETYTHTKSTEESGNQITSLDFNNTGVYFATGGKDCCVRVYDSDSMVLTRSYTGTNSLDIDSLEDVTATPGHSKKVFAVKFHPDDSNIFFSASWDRTLKFWDLRTDYAVRTVHGPFICGDGLDIFHNTVLTASWQALDSLQLWDYTSGQLIKTVPYPTLEHKGEYLYCARFFDEHNIVAGGSGANDLKVINVISNKVVGSLSGFGHPVQAVEVMEKKNMLLCGTSGNLLQTATLIDRKSVV